MFLLLSVEEIRKANFGIYVLCYAQTSPLGVSTYAFGFPTVPFVCSEQFFLSLSGMLKRPDRKGQNKFGLNFGNEWNNVSFIVC